MQQILTKLLSRRCRLVGDIKVLVFIVHLANAMATWNQQPIPRHHCVARTRSCGHNCYAVQGNAAESVYSHSET